MTSPMPAPITPRVTPTAKNGVLVWASPSPPRPTPIINRPSATLPRAPSRLATTLLIDDVTIMVPAKGRAPNPASNGL
jgi:hypothetical protein